jgi:hypothetical protein
MDISDPNWNGEQDHLDNDDSTVSTVVSSNANADDDQSVISGGYSPNKNFYSTQIKKIKTKRHPDCYKVVLPQKIKQRVRYKDKDGKPRQKTIVKVKQMPVYFYETSSNPGATIRDAITGQYYSGYNVGKAAHEDQFYKTAYVIGDACKPGQKIGDNREPQFLYFMNPESFERHFKISMNTERKEKWYNQQIELRRQRDEPEPTGPTITIK